MKRAAAALLVVVLLAGQSLPGLCVDATPGAEAGGHPSATAHPEHTPVPAGDADHGPHHEGEERCGAVMACGLVGAVSAPTGGLDGLTMPDRSLAEPGSFRQQPPPPQDPPPPRFG
jgi:hypothetical protein